LGSQPDSQQLNEALHELRRPLQGLALLLDGQAAPTGAAELLEQATHSLTQLDGLVNGFVLPRDRAPATLEELATEARKRWGARVEVDGPPVRGRASVVADRHRVAAALDNLIANALEHGSGPIRLRARTEGGSVRLDVASRGEPGPPRDGADPRRGHGLRVVERVAAEHGGSAFPPRSESGHTVAGISLPRSGGGRGAWPQA
jgi:signal transduction histidine kinase